MFYKKQKPKIIQYKNYKNFNEKIVRAEMEKESAKNDLNNAELAEFPIKFLSVLNKHTPVKHKCILVNNSTYMTKCLKARTHCEISLSDHFMKHSLMHISIHLI